MDTLIASVIGELKEERSFMIGAAAAPEWPGRPIGFQPQTVVSEACELCGHHYAELHRLVPGCWGGRYEPRNCMWLCPNHHNGIHFLMCWYYCKTVGGPVYMKDSGLMELRQAEYIRDVPLRMLWVIHGKQIVVDRLKAEGRRHPYVRTLPSEPQFSIPK